MLQPGLGTAHHGSASHPALPLLCAADTDVAYTVKPLWESYLEYMDRNEADGAWQAESPRELEQAAGCVVECVSARPADHDTPPCHDTLWSWLLPCCAVNSGHFVLRPTPAALRFAEAWNASAADNVPTLTSEQKALPQFQDTHFVTCRSPCLCYKQKFKVGKPQGKQQCAGWWMLWLAVTAALLSDHSLCLARQVQLLDEGRRDDVAVFAVYFPGIFMYTQAGCTVGSPEWVPDVDPCDWSGVRLELCGHGVGVARDCALPTQRCLHHDLTQLSLCPLQCCSCTQSALAARSSSKPS